MRSRKVTDYVASNRNIVRGLETKQLKAYQLSKDLLGAYDEVSAMGQAVRRHLIPFYSFLETNLKRYYRLFANPIVNMVEEGTSKDSTGDKVKKISGDAAKLLYRIAAANALMMLMMLVNRVLKRDDDDKLPEEVRARPHFTFGRIGDVILHSPG